MSSLIVTVTFQMSEDNIEIGICNADGFRRLTPQEVKDYLANIA
jgi:20S proteasome subunit alpha 2